MSSLASSASSSSIEVLTTKPSESTYIDQRGNLHEENIDGNCKLACMEDDLDDLIERHNIKVASDSDVMELVETLQRHTMVSFTKNGASPTVILWRGCSLETANNMARNGTASGQPKKGMTLLGKDISDESVKKQVGGDHGSILPEFAATCEEDDTNVAKSFSAGSALVAVEIAVDYLRRGSGESAESGWVCDPNAPVRVTMIINRQCIDFDKVMREQTGSQRKTNKP